MKKLIFIGILAVGLFASSAQAALVTDNLLVSLDTGNYSSGQTWTDQAPFKANDAYLGTSASDTVEDPTFNAGNAVFEFSSADTGDRIVRPVDEGTWGTFDAGYLYNNTTFSVETWLKVDPNTGYMCPLDLRTGGGRQGFLLKCDVALKTVTAQVCAGWTAQTAILSSWDKTIVNHLAVTVQSDGTTDEIKMYLNGQLDSTTPITINPSDKHVYFDDLTLGCAKAGSLTDLDGEIAAFRLYADVLTADEVAQNYAEGYNIPEPATVVLLALGGLGILGRKRK
ncbi:MAG: LamG-like jellyroll fold domain-containing protein [Planctomycetota bacterium]